MSGVRGATRIGNEKALVATRETRGVLVSEIGAAGVADKLVYVSKDATDTYVRNELVPGPTTDPTIIALAAYNTNGLLTQTAPDTFTGRAITAGSSNISVTNGDGVSGNPIVDLASGPSVTTLTVASTTLLQGFMRYVGNGTTPTIAPQAGAGTGATVANIDGDGFHCDFDLIAGTGPTTGAQVRIPFGTTLANTKYIAEIHKRNANAASMDWYVGTRNVAYVEINSNTALTNGQTYALTVVVKGRN